MRKWGVPLFSNRELTTALTTTMTTVGLPDTSAYPTLELVSCLIAPSAVLTMDTYADLFPDDLELVSAALDKARQAALRGTADQLRTETEKDPTRITSQGL